MSVRGVVYVHSAPPAVCPHAEWALSSVVGTRVSLQWTPQAAEPGTLRASVAWQGAVGTAARLATALGQWRMLRFEVTEDASPGSDGERICHIPGRGFWRASVSANGDLMIGESQLRHILDQARCLDDVRERIHDALGADVDSALEPFRRADDGAAVTWLHQVG